MKKAKSGERRIPSCGTMTGIIYANEKNRGGGGYAEIKLDCNEIRRIAEELKKIELAKKTHDKKYLAALDVIADKMSGYPQIDLFIESVMGKHKVKFVCIPKQSTVKKE